MGSTVTIPFTRLATQRCDGQPMTDNVVSLSSDTETRPTPGMRAAMAAAEVGDEQKGQDPTVTRLQQRVAALLGKAAALWFPTGTMCNLVAVKTHTRPGDAIVADWMAHVIRAESGGAALASGVQVEPIRTDRGIFTPAELDVAMDRVTTVPAPYGQAVRLVCIEQTHNFGGGAVWSLDELAAVSACARSRDVPLHMDGARLMNACVASGVSPAAFAAEVDSLWIDFTKGLGAPIGAVLAGTRDFIATARRYKAALRRRHAAGGDCRGRVPVCPRPKRRPAGRGPRARPSAGERSGGDRRYRCPHGRTGHQHGVLRRQRTRDEQ